MTHHDRKIFGFRFLLKIFGFRFCWKYFGFRFCWNAESFSVTEKFSVFLGWDRTNDAELTPKPVSALHFRFYRIGAEPNLYPWVRRHSVQKIIFVPGTKILYPVQKSSKLIQVLFFVLLFNTFFFTLKTCQSTSESSTMFSAERMHLWKFSCLNFCTRYKFFVPGTTFCTRYKFLYRVSPTPLVLARSKLAGRKQNNRPEKS